MSQGTFVPLSCVDNVTKYGKGKGGGELGTEYCEKGLFQMAQFFSQEDPSLTLNQVIFGSFPF